MRLSTIAALCLVPAAMAQNATSYLNQVLAALTAANLTSLVSVAQGIASDPAGMALLGSLAVGNKTVFAPNNAAFSAVPQNVSSNTTLLTQILSYHILNNTYTVNGTQVAPMHTIARTLLNGGGYSLPGNFSAPLVLDRNMSGDSMFNIVQVSDNVTAMGPAAAANLLVYIIPEVLSLPPTLPAAATALLPSLAGLIGQANLLGPLAAASGITVFAPSDAAISSAAAALAPVAANNTLLTNVLANHVINGSVVYSTGLSTGNYTSAAGSPFMFMTNTSGTYVMSGNSTARIIRSDIIISNGVVHLIDGVLANTASNPAAAASAYSSATAAAATSMEPTAAVTATSTMMTASGGSGASGASGASGSASATSKSAGGLMAPFNWYNSAVGGALTVAGLLLGGGVALL